MNNVSIAFDVDGTLIRNDSDGDMDSGPPVVNERIRSLLIALASFKNTTIIVWSGGGELYARRTGACIGIDQYVDSYASKNPIGRDSEGTCLFDPEWSPDIVIDDIYACELGRLNLIVNEK